MISRQTGRRVSTIAAERRTVAGRKRSGGARQMRRRDAPLAPRERHRVLQLVACGAIFVLLVAVKLLLSDKMAQFNRQLSDALRQNMDVQAVFSAVGQAVSGEADVGGAVQDVYRAVFHPQGAGEALETAVISGGERRFAEPAALDSFREFRRAQAAAETEPPEAESQAEVSSLAYVLYSEQNLPANVNLEQAILGFAYCTPVAGGTMSSDFGYREHPVEGEERFHYGVDIAADTGTDIVCFADGTVTAVGESSSYGKYLMVAHEGGCTTLYAHCSRITVSSGAAVTEGQKIAEVGESGMATGPHLHFELQREGMYLNPVYYVSLV